MYIVFRHFSDELGLFFGGIFTTKELAEEVVKRENEKLGSTDLSWYDFIKVEPDDDFLKNLDY